MTPDQVRVVTEKAKQLGCWPLDYTIASTDRDDAITVVFGTEKGRPRTLVVHVDGQTTPA